MKRQSWDSLDKGTAKPSQWDQFPHIVNQIKELKRKWIDWQYCERSESGKWIDIRLQVYESGVWAVRWGDSQYDLDHRGYWGSSSISPKTNCKDLAKELIEQVFESFCTMGGNQ